MGPSRLPSRGDVDREAENPGPLNEQLRQLAAAAATGDLEATDTLLYAIVSQRLAEPGIRRVLVEPDDVDEVVQDVLIVVAEQVHSFRAESRFTTWLNGVGRNKALEFVRRKQRGSRGTESPPSDSERISSLVADKMLVGDLLTRLPEHYRLAVTLRDIEGLSYDDVATTLDLNLNTAKAHIARGRALLALCAATPG